VLSEMLTPGRILYKFLGCMVVIAQMMMIWGFTLCSIMSLFSAFQRNMLPAL
jgi:hypothetical protein